MKAVALAVGLFLACGPAFGEGLKPEAISDASFSGKMPKDEAISPLAVKLQVMLDRARFSPGEIDGRFGDNVEKALRAFAEANGLPAGNALTTELWAKLESVGGGAIVADYTLTEQDIKGPYLDKLPAKMEDMQSLKALSYVSVREAIAERFHMSEDLLAALNPGQNFDKAGATIRVVAPGRDKEPPKSAWIEVDKERQTVKAFGKDGKLIAFFPASVGSEEKPTPSGALKVRSIDAHPTYRYDPKYKFSGVEATKPFEIKAGPNNPVGSMWIGLSQASYGIHGTAEPSHVSKRESHGCVRLTNWDAERLAKMVKKGVEVRFVENKQAAR